MSTEPPGAVRDGRRTLQYFGWLTLLVYLVTPVGYLIDIQTSYLLKNQLHASAAEVSTFRLLTALPVYFAFVFGLVRDSWSPLGLGDRGFFLIFGALTAAAFMWMAVSPPSYSGLVVSMLLAMVAFRFVSAAYGGLIALVGQAKLMSGRLSAVWNIVSTLPVIAGAFTSGYISAHLGPRQAFTLAAAGALLIVLTGLWKPVSVFAGLHGQPAGAESFVGRVKRLVKHRAIYPAILINLLWNFAPGANTPLQFYLTNTLHASDSVYSYYIGIFVASFIPTFVLYGYLCKKVALDRLLWWGTIFAVPQMIPLALIHSGTAALVLAVPIGLMGGIATAAYIDLAMRSCPPGLQGTMMTLVDGVLVLSSRGGDLVGSKIYSSSPEHGFLYCVIAITVVYALILPLIKLVPKDLIASRDGEENPALQAAQFEPG